jgi:Protein of unknown function (DUF2971)
MTRATLISDLWEPIQKYIGALNTRSMPAVHHYTSVKGALGILDSGQMWFTERAHLNDPSEISHGIDLAKSILCAKGRSYDATRLDDSTKRVFHDFRFFSASFSFEHDDLSQWRNYSDDGNGVVLSFKASAFNNPHIYISKIIPDNPTVIVCPMSYDPEHLKQLIESIIKKWTGGDIEKLCDHLFMISSLFKGDCWKSENEYRFFVHQKRDQILKRECFKVRERNSNIVTYLEIPIQNWESTTDFPIYRICLGPAAPCGLDAELSDFIFAKGISISQDNIVRSTIPYRSVRQIF